MTTITVCTTCRQPELREAREGAPCGEALAAALHRAAAQAPGVVVRETACLMGCNHGCNVTVAARGKMAYVLGAFAPGPEAAEAIVAYAAAHAESPSGVVPYRQWPQGVKGHFVARVPPPEG